MNNNTKARFKQLGGQSSSKPRRSVRQPQVNKHAKVAYSAAK